MMHKKITIYSYCIQLVSSQKSVFFASSVLDCLHGLRHKHSPPWQCQASVARDLQSASSRKLHYSAVCTVSCIPFASVVVHANVCENDAQASAHANQLRHHQIGRMRAAPCSSCGKLSVHTMQFWATFIRRGYVTHRGQTMHATLQMLNLTSDKVGCRWSSVFCSEPHGPWVTQNEFCNTTKTVGRRSAWVYLQIHVECPPCPGRAV